MATEITSEKVHKSRNRHMSIKNHTYIEFYVPEYLDYEANKVNLPSTLS